MDGDYQTVIDTIANVGFPCVVAIYLLVRMERRITSLSENISKLTQVLQNWGK